MTTRGVGYGGSGQFGRVESAFGLSVKHWGEKGGADSRNTRAISSSALSRSVPLSGSDVDADSYASSFEVVVPMAPPFLAPGLCTR